MEETFTSEKGISAAPPEIKAAPQPTIRDLLQQAADGWKTEEPTAFTKAQIELAKRLRSSDGLDHESGDGGDDDNPETIREFARSEERANLLQTMLVTVAMDNPQKLVDPTVVKLFQVLIGEDPEPTPPTPTEA